jgi:PleD family two-component response regulator
LPNRKAVDCYLEQIAATPLDCLGAIALSCDDAATYVKTYGHEQARKAHDQIASALGQVAAPLGSLIAHYEMWTFVVFVPGAHVLGTMRLAANMRLAVEQLGIAHDESRCADVITLSAGVAATEHPGYDPVRALATAMLNMESVIRAGGNRVASSTGQVSEGYF